MEELAEEVMAPRLHTASLAEAKLCRLLAFNLSVSCGVWAGFGEPPGRSFCPDQPCLWQRSQQCSNRELRGSSCALIFLICVKRISDNQSLRVSSLYMHARPSWIREANAAQSAHLHYSQQSRSTLFVEVSRLQAAPTAQRAPLGRSWLGVQAFRMSQK